MAMLFISVFAAGATFIIIRIANATSFEIVETSSKYEGYLD